MTQDEQKTADRAKAANASRGCSHCGGNGLVEVYHRDYRGKTIVETTDSRGEVIRVAGIVSAHCSCEFGRWMRMNSAADVITRIPDFAVVQSGRSPWLMDDPTAGPIDPAIFGMTTHQALRYLAAKNGPIAKPVQSKDLPAREKRVPDSREAADVPF